MAEVFDYIIKYPFVRYGLAVCILTSLCAALLGVTLVLKRYSYIGDGLSHVAFGAFAIAAVLNFTNEILIVMPVTVIVAIILINGAGRFRADSALAMLSVASLSVGYILYNKFPSSSANISGDVCTSLFGSTSILTLKTSDLIVSIIMTAAVLLFYFLFYNRIFAVTFDPTFSKATGLRTRVYETLIAIITGVVISLSMRLVGSLLVSAIVVFPCISSMQVFKTFKSVVISSAIFSITAAFLGMMASMMFSTPVGASVVIADLIGFAAFTIVKRLVRCR